VPELISETDIYLLCHLVWWFLLFLFFSNDAFWRNDYDLRGFFDFFTCNGCAGLKAGAGCDDCAGGANGMLWTD